MTMQEDWDRAKKQAENMSPEELDKMIADFASGDWFRRLLQKQREREL